MIAKGDLEYVNDEPITDSLIVLDLLYNDRWEWKIARRSDGSWRPHDFEEKEKQVVR